MDGLACHIDKISYELLKSWQLEDFLKGGGRRGTQIFYEWMQARHAIFIWFKHLYMFYDTIQAEDDILIFDLHLQIQKSMINNITTVALEWM